MTARYMNGRLVRAAAACMILLGCATAAVLLVTWLGFLGSSGEQPLTGLDEGALSTSTAGDYPPLTGQPSSGLLHSLFHQPQTSLAVWITAMRAAAVILISIIGMVAGFYGLVFAISVVLTPQDVSARRSERPTPVSSGTPAAAGQAEPSSILAKNARLCPSLARKRRRHRIDQRIKVAGFRLSSAVGDRGIAD